MITVKALVENTSFQPDVVSEHGLSLLIRSSAGPLLFDTGQTDAFIRNAAVFDSRLHEVENVIISHGHYDHTGGLPAFLAMNAKARVYCRRDALVPKYSSNYNEKRQINLPLISAYEKFTGRFVFIEKNTLISPGIMIVTDILTRTKFENDEPNLTRNRSGMEEKDPFDDELFVIIEESDGISVVTGCSHRGIINIIHTAMQLHPGTRIKHVIGGFHLRNKSEERIGPVLKALNTLPVGQLDICHCTGIDEYGMIRNEFNGKTQYLSTGTLLKL